jgi:glycosyltransferase involved in cell wall biosynthesis
MTKRLLIIAYNFPPMGGGGVQRTVKFVKYLPRFGWESVVLTASDPGYWAVDTSLAADIPDGTHVERIHAGRRFPAVSILSRIVGPRFARSLGELLFFPDDKISWAKKAARRGARLAKERPIDAILSTSPTPSAHTAAQKISRRMHIPWIVDFRDLWSGDYRRGADPSWIERRRLAAEGRILNSAHHAVCATGGFRTCFIERHRLDPLKITAVHNGFDPDDFPDIERRRKKPGDDAPIVLIHSGSLYGEGLPEGFLHGVARLRETRPQLFRRLVLRFIGVMDDGITERIGAVLGESARFDGYLDHKNAVEAVRRADIALLAAPHRENASLVVHGKLFEYLASGIPILASIPGGEAADIIERTGTGVVITERDPEDIARMLPDVIASLLGGKAFRPDRDEIDAFNRIPLTGRLADILDKTTEQGHA